MKKTVIAIVVAGVAISAGVARLAGLRACRRRHQREDSRRGAEPIAGRRRSSTCSSTSIGPRLTASPAHKRAAECARDTLTKYGLTNARLEPFEFGRGWELDKLTIEMVEPRYMPLLGYAEAWSPSTSGELIVPVGVGRRQVRRRRRARCRAAQGRGGAAAADRHQLHRRRIASQPTSQPDPPPRVGCGRPARVARGSRQGGAGGRRAQGGGRATPTDLQDARRGRAAQAEPRHARHGVRAGRPAARARRTRCRRSCSPASTTT